MFSIMLTVCVFQIVFLGKSISDDSKWTDFLISQKIIKT